MPFEAERKHGHNRAVSLMKFREYFEAKGVTLCFLGLGGIFGAVILLMAEAKVWLVMMLGDFFAFLVFSWLGVGYAVERRRIVSLRKLMDTLPKKYLLGEVLPKPSNAITTVTQQMSTVAIQGLSQAGCIMVGQTLGEGDRKRAEEEGWAILGLGILVGILGGILIMALSEPIIGCYNITEETKEITQQLMDAVGFIVIFQTMDSVLTKGVLRGGGDTKFLMLADILFLWAASIPLGYLAGLVWHLSAFWIYTLLKIDQIIKYIWCIWRLKSGRWIKKIEAR